LPIPEPEHHVIGALSIVTVPFHRCSTSIVLLHNDTHGDELVGPLSLLKQFIGDELAGPLSLLKQFIDM
jgi:hypothetical protein